MSKFTPGPWSVGGRTRGGHCVFISAQNWTHFAKVVVKMKGGDSDLPEGNANARLIAAAPEMAALLKRYLETAAIPIANVIINDIDADARALLSRIEGGP